MALYSDCRAFITRGNIIDMAVGIIIGASFTSIVKSVLDDILMPLLSLVTRGVDNSEFFYVLQQGEPKGP